MGLQVNVKSADTCSRPRSVRPRRHCVASRANGPVQTKLDSYVLHNSMGRHRQKRVPPNHSRENHVTYTSASVNGHVVTSVYSGQLSRDYHARLRSSAHTTVNGAPLCRTTSCLMPDADGFDAQMLLFDEAPAVNGTEHASLSRSPSPELLLNGCNGIDDDYLPDTMNGKRRRRLTEAQRLLLYSDCHKMRIYSDKLRHVPSRVAAAAAASVFSSLTHRPASTTACGLSRANSSPALYTQSDHSLRRVVSAHHSSCVAASFPLLPSAITEQSSPAANTRLSACTQPLLPPLPAVTPLSHSTVDSSCVHKQPLLCVTRLPGHVSGGALSACLYTAPASHSSTCVHSTVTHSHGTRPAVCVATCQCQLVQTHTAVCLCEATHTTHTPHTSSSHSIAPPDHSQRAAAVTSTACSRRTGSLRHRPDVCQHEHSVDAVSTASELAATTELSLVSAPVSTSLYRHTRAECSTPTCAFVYSFETQSHRAKSWYLSYARASRITDPLLMFCGQRHQLAYQMSSEQLERARDNHVATSGDDILASQIASVSTVCDSFTTHVFARKSPRCHASTLSWQHSSSCSSTHVEHEPDIPPTIPDTSCSSLQPSSVQCCKQTDSTPIWQQSHASLQSVWQSQCDALLAVSMPSTDPPLSKPCSSRGQVKRGPGRPRVVKLDSKTWPGPVLASGIASVEDMNHIAEAAGWDCEDVSFFPAPPPLSWDQLFASTTLPLTHVSENSTDSASIKVSRVSSKRRKNKTGWPSANKSRKISLGG